MPRQPGLAISGPALGFSSAHFELASECVGERFSISVTLPPGYSDDGPRRYPIVYATDAYTNCAFTVGATSLLLGDRLRPIEPFILVNIGYADNDIPGSLARRNREFVPPGEPPSDVLERHIQAPDYAAILGKGGHERFMAFAHNGRADNFLAFFEQELHPQIARRFNVTPERAALFGHSFGGLFTLYAFTSGTALFDKYCAASPGLLCPDTTIFTRYKALAAGSKNGRRATDLYVTLADLEITGSLEIYRELGANTLRLIDLIEREPLPGLRFGRSIVQDETHFSTAFEAFRRFIRFSFPVPA